MTEQLGVGIIGCGQVAQAIHLPVLYSLPELFRVAHLVDASSSVLARVAPGVDVPRGTDHLGLLANPDVDVVLVASPDAYHARHAVDACRAAKRAVLVEKPLALTPGEAHAVARASAEHGVPVQVGTMHVYDAAFRAALPYMDARPDLVLVETILGPNDWNRDDAIQLVRGRPDVDDGEVALGYVGAVLKMGGIDTPAGLFMPALQLLGLSCHDLAPLRALLGEPRGVDGLTLTPGGGYQVTLDYGGTKAMLTVYWHRTRLASWRLRWFTPDRQVEVRFPQSWGTSLASEASVYELANGVLREERLGGRYETGFREEWRHLHRVATEGAAPLTPSADAADDVALVERIVATAAKRPTKAADATGVLILGAGNITATHAAIIDALPGARVAAVASRSMRSAERRAWRYGCEAATFDDIDRLLATSGVNVALIASPPSLHAEHAKRALAAGKHVIVEKPLCRTLAEADELRRAAAASRGRIAYAENYAFIPAIRAAADAVAARAIGDVTSLHVYTLHERPAHGDFLTPEWGGGALFDMGPHTLYWALMLAGFPSVISVSAQLESRTPDEGDDFASVTLDLEGGVTARVDVSWRESSPRSGAVVNGAAGDLELTLLPHSGVVVKKGDDVTPLDVDQAYAGTAAGGYVGKFGYRAQVEAFLRAFADGASPRPGLEDATMILELIVAAYASARSGVPVPLPFSGARDRTPYELWRGQ